MGITLRKRITILQMREMLDAQQERGLRMEWVGGKHIIPPASKLLGWGRAERKVGKN